MMRRLCCTIRWLCENHALVWVFVFAVVNYLLAGLHRFWTYCFVRESTCWHIKYGSWWMIQWSFDWWFSLGVHIDLKRRFSVLAKKWYGPYVDIHLGCAIFSIGLNPVYSGELDASVSVGRGGIRGGSD